MTQSTNYNHTLLLNLYHQSVVSSPDQSRYKELNLFRRQIEIEKIGPHHKPYEAKLKQAFFYQLVFYGLGGLFLLLSILVYQHSINWFIYSAIFSSFYTAKIVMCTLCLIFSAASFAVGYSIRAEKEAVYQLLRRTKRKLARIYHKQFHLAGPFSFKESYRQYRMQRLEYQHVLDKVNESKEVTFLLLDQISNSASHTQEEKATLFNQAILELNDRLHQLINQFQKGTPLKTET